MSRSGYSEDGDDDTWAFIRYRGAVNSAIKGQRGQAFLVEVLALLDAMPVKELVDGELEADGQYCTLGVVGHARGLDLSKVDTSDWSSLSGTFNIAEVLAREIMYINDDSVRSWSYEQKLPGGSYDRVPTANAGAKRWAAVREWVVANIIPAKPVGSTS